MANDYYIDDSYLQQQQEQEEQEYLLYMEELKLQEQLNEQARNKDQARATVRS